MTDRARINEICSAMPGAEWSSPFGPGHDCWKVGEKIFALMGSMDHGLSVKTDSVETAQMLIDAGVGEKAPYLHRSWVRLPPGTAEDEIRHRIETSYDIIRAGLTKKAQAALPSRKESV